MLQIICWSPVESAGICWSPVESAGVRWSPVESAGICWSPMESGGIRWNLLESAGVRWSLLESGGLVQRNSMMEFRGLQRNSPYSGGLRWTPPGLNMPIRPLSHQHIPGFESAGIHWNPLESGGTRGGVYSPPQVEAPIP